MEELKNKIKNAIVNSSFPLEMSLSQQLDEKDWKVIVGRPYYDFEYDILRETDIIARKDINGYTVTLFIECKKSQDKQLLLYLPYSHLSDSPLIALDSKVFPVKQKKNNFRLEDFGDVEQELLNLYKLYKIFDSPFISQNIIFTKGDKIFQDNQKFFTSLLGLIKSSIWFYKELFIIDKKEIYVYSLVYDGNIYGLYPDRTKSEYFDLRELEYGIYKQILLFNYSQINSQRFPDFKKYLELFGSSYLFQIIRPSFFPYYIEHIENAVKNFVII